MEVTAPAAGDRRPERVKDDARHRPDGSAEPTVRRGVEPYVYALTSVAAVATGIAFATLARLPTDLLFAPAVIGTAVALTIAFIGFQFWGFEFAWRGHRLTASFEEILVFVALLYLPGPSIVPVMISAGVVLNGMRRRARIKMLFNVTHDVVSVFAAWAVYALLVNAGLPPVVAAIPAIPTYITLSNLLLSGVFSRLEGVGTLRVFWERLAANTALVSVIGAAGGILVHALLTFHPLAILALSPIVLILKRNTVLASRADRELSVHRTLGEVSLDLVGTSDLDAVAERVLATTGGVLNAGRVTLRLDSAATGGETRTWTRTFLDTPSSEAPPGLAVRLPGPDGAVIGELTAEPRPGNPAFAEIDQALARIVAGQAASTILNARALIALEDAREAALEQQDRLAKQEKLSTLGMLIANVSHEIGNPMTYMRSSLELSLTEAETLTAHADEGARVAGERIREDLASALRGVDRIREITQSLKSVARQGPKGLKLASMNDLARDVANVVKVGMPRSIRLTLELEDELPPVNANAGELTQVVLNLVKNAAEAIGQEPGQIVVRTRAVDGRVHLSVEDDGPGMTDEVQSRLFEAFFTTKEKGTGLGLNISRRIVENHGGRLLIESAIGRGTTFTLDLPRSEDS